jgi:hypothetical protein
MWTPCPQVLDEPVKILGVELEDFVLIATFPLCLSLFLDTVPCFVGTALLAYGLYRAKRGRPPGALLHWLHAMELVRLPGVLSPRPQRYSPW